MINSFLLVAVNWAAMDTNIEDQDVFLSIYCQSTVFLGDLNTHDTCRIEMMLI